MAALGYAPAAKSIAFQALPIAANTKTNISASGPMIVHMNSNNCENV